MTHGRVGLCRKLSRRKPRSPEEVVRIAKAALGALHGMCGVMHQLNILTPFSATLERVKIALCHYANIKPSQSK